MVTRTEIGAILIGLLGGLLGNFLASGLFHFIDRGPNGDAPALITIGISLGTIATIVYWFSTHPALNAEGKETKKKESDGKNEVSIDRNWLILGFFASASLVVEQVFEIASFKDLTYPVFHIAILVFGFLMCLPLLEITMFKRSCP